MMARLATRLGITEDSDNESDGDVDVSSDEIRVNPFDAKKEGGLLNAYHAGNVKNISFNTACSA